MSFFIRNLEELKQIEVKNAHGGEGVIYVRQLLGFQEGADFPGDRSDFDSNVNFVHRLILPPGSSIGDHEHIDSEEFYYVEEGNALMIADSEEIRMPEKSIFMIKKGSNHAFINDSNTDVVAIVVEISLNTNKAKGGYNVKDRCNSNPR